MSGRAPAATERFSYVRELLRNFAKAYDAMAFHGRWLSADAAHELHEALLAVGVVHAVSRTHYRKRAGNCFT